MPTPVVLIFVALMFAAAVLTYVARPVETPEQFANRLCKQDRPSGTSFEKCVEGRILQHLAGRQDTDR